MPVDTLAKYPTTLPTIKDVVGEPYIAFEAAASPQKRIDLRPGYAVWRIVNYLYLTQIIHAGGMLVGLSFSTPLLTVEIKGKNLQGMIDLLREGRVSVITEYVSERHAKVAEGQPKIDTLKITAVGKPAVEAPRKQ